MKDMIAYAVSNYQALLWLLATVVLVIVEASTAQMICIWFALGALVTVFAAMMGAPLLVQFLIFVGVSGVTLAFTRRFVTGLLTVKKTPTNADSVIGLCGSAIEEIDNVAQTGRIRVNGLDWAARTQDNSVVHIGGTVEVKAIQGVKLIVVPK